MHLVLLLEHGHRVELDGVPEETLRSLLLSPLQEAPTGIDHEGGVFYVTPRRVVAVESS